MARLLSTAALLVSVLSLVSCGGFFGRQPSTRAVVPAVADIAAAIMAAHPAGDINLFGFRDDGGERTTNAEALDEFLLAALMNAGAPVATGVGVVAPDAAAAKKWKSLLLPDNWRDLPPAALLLSGQLHSRSPWIYSTVLLADGESGEVVDSWRHRFSEREVERYAGQFAKRRGGRAADATEVATTIEVDLHLVARHSESGFVEWLEPTEGGALQPGDKFQLRFRVRTDCTVYAFLYQSDGEVEVILENQIAYPGRLYEMPGEEQWISPQENEVYTLYFIAAADLEEDMSGLFHDLGELVRRGQIDRFEGLELLDSALVGFLSRSETGNVTVLRGETARGKSENFVYADGESVDSKPQLLSASPVLVRALSFEVQYQ